jgi:hypothetical protein
MKRILQKPEKPTRRLPERIQRIQEQFDNLTQEEFNVLVGRILATNIALAKIINGETDIEIDFSDTETHEGFKI